MIKILMVCTGNICRSPFAERMLQHYFDAMAPGDYEISSAGTLAMVKREINESAAQKILDLGGDTSEFAARQLNLDMLQEAELVLTMTEEQRTTVVSMSPRMMKRVFTIREFSVILQLIEADSTDKFSEGTKHLASAHWATLRKLAALRRFEANQILRGNLDVDDPYRQGEQAFTTMVEQLVPCLQTIANFQEKYLRP